MNDTFLVAMCFFIMCVMCVLFILGWVSGHGTIATEWEKLGAFYVGNTVYECRVEQG